MAFVCTTCGAAAETPGHLCSPCDTAASGTFCDIAGNGTRHACRDKTATVQFYCTTCGQVAEEKRYLCNPEPIDN
ncbi:hypothetical protein [Desulfobulbus elongatus]|uniref:hypothetical protein n=1 Tax=Desulfobulbus elongatus TaxID=53332 RepID=UPI000489CF23|nr:hypothetical protein [Desulfobulbus elongatus]